MSVILTRRKEGRRGRIKDFQVSRAWGQRRTVRAEGKNADRSRIGRTERTRDLANAGHSIKRGRLWQCPRGLLCLRLVTLLCKMYSFIHPRLFTGRLLLRSTRPYHSPSPLKSVSELDVAHFANFLAPSSILSTLPPSSAPATDLDQYNNDWMGKYHGTSSTVLKPKSTKEVSEIVKYCWENRIGVVPQGGNTGLVGGSVPIRDELIVSLANMNKIRSFDPVSGIYSLAFIFPLSWSIKDRYQVYL